MTWFSTTDSSTSSNLPKPSSSLLRSDGFILLVLSFLMALHGLRCMYGSGAVADWSEKPSRRAQQWAGRWRISWLQSWNHSQLHWLEKLPAQTRHEENNYVPLINNIYTHYNKLHVEYITFKMHQNEPNCSSLYSNNLSVLMFHILW